MATQSEIAVRVTHLLMMENEMLYKWSYKQKSYGLYGRRISDLDRIRREVEKVTNADICATDRLGTTITARRIFIFLCYTTMVTPNMSSIARYLGLVSHATVLHHKNKMKELIEIQDYESTLLLKQICKNLNIQFLKANQID